MGDSKGTNGGSEDGPDGFAWRGLFEGRSPREILVRLLEGDPLGIEVRCEERVRERALLMNPHRLALRAFARTAHAAYSYRGMPPFRDWLQGCIDRAIDDLISEDLEEERRAIPAQLRPDESYPRVFESLGIEPELARRVCIVVNSMDDAMRHAFFAVYVRKVSVNHYVAEGNGPPQVVRALLEAALERLRRLRGSGGAL